MKYFNRMLAVILLITLNACEYYHNWIDSKNNSTSIITVTNYDWKQNATSTDTTYLKVVKNKDSIQFIYYRTENLTERNIYESCMYKFNHDTILYFNGKNCPLIEIRKISINGDETVVKKFLYDELEMADDETLIYFNESLGIISTYCYSWLFIIGTFERDLKSKGIIEYLLNDTTDFYPHYYSYPRPPSDR